MVRTGFCWFYFLFFKDFIKLFLKRWERRENERERNIDVRNIYQLPLICTRLGRTRNLGVCPDWQSKQWPFPLRGDARPNSATQVGAEGFIFNEVTRDYHGLCNGGSLLSLNSHEHVTFPALLPPKTNPCLTFQTSQCVHREMKSSA